MVICVNHFYTVDYLGGQKRNKIIKLGRYIIYVVGLLRETRRQLTAGNAPVLKVKRPGLTHL